MCLFFQTVEKAKSESKRSLKQLDDYLKTRTFLVGERITLADINIASVLLPLYVKLMDAKERGAYTNVTRWLDTLINQPQFKSVLGDVKYCQTAPTFKEGGKFANLIFKIVYVRCQRSIPYLKNI